MVSSHEFENLPGDLEARVRAMRATGANPRMSRAQGIDTRIYIVLGVGLSNGLIAVSGVMVAQHQGFADVSSGAGLIIAGLAVTRYVLRIEPIASVPAEQLVAAVGPTVQRYLTGDLTGAFAAG